MLLGSNMNHACPHVLPTNPDHSYSAQRYGLLRWTEPGLAKHFCLKRHKSTFTTCPCVNLEPCSAVEYTITGAFFEKGTKIIPQTKLTFKNLKSLISKTISVKWQWFRIFSVQKSVPNQYKGKTALWNWLHSEISRISNFWMWVWGVIFAPF